MRTHSRILLSFTLLGSLVGCSAGRPAAPTTAAESRPDAPTTERPELEWRALVLQAEDTRTVTAALRSSLSAELPAVRRLGVRALGRIRDHSADDLVIAAMQDSSATVRAAAIFAAGISGIDAALTPMLPASSDPDPRVRAAVAIAAGLLDRPESQPLLLGLLDDPSSEVRVGTCDGIARLTHADSALIDRLIDVVHGDDGRVSFSAIYALSRLSGRLSALSFADRFKARTTLLEFASVSDPTIRSWVAEGLYNPIAGKQADALAQMYTDSQELEVRLAILRATSLPGAPTFVFHEKSIESGDDRIVLATILGLGRMKGERVNSLLINFILRDERSWLRAEAIRSLALADRRMALTVANGLSGDSDPEILAATAEILQGRAEPEAAEYAGRMIRSEHRAVRLAAIPALAGAQEPLSKLLTQVVQHGNIEDLIQVARAAGFRLALTDRTADDTGDTLGLLADLWTKASKLESAAFQISVLEAAAAAAPAPAAVRLLRDGAKVADYGVSELAVSLLAERFDLTDVQRTMPVRPLDYYREIAAWAETQHAAVITLKRPGFAPGRFTVALDSANAPLTSWNFYRRASSGYYDNRAIDRLLPGLRLHSGRGSDSRFSKSSSRDETFAARFGAGVVAAAGRDRDRQLGEWLVILTERPNYLGRYVPFGRVVQNLEGVVRNILPFDRVLAVRVYEGTGEETLPPLR